MAAFKSLQSQLIKQPCLAFPTSDGEFQLYTDASGGIDGAEGALGAALTQIQKGEKRMIAYASRRLKKHERNYSAYLLEKAAIVYAIEHFAHLLKGRRFVVFTDHRPITTLSKVHTKTFNRLEQLLVEFSFDIRYIPGKHNSVADFLSREGWIQPDHNDGLGVAALDTGQERIAVAQQKDELCLQMRAATTPETKAALCTRLQIKDFADIKGILRVQLRPRQGFPPGRDGRIVAPATLRPHLIKQGHDAAIAGHGGIFKTKERIAEEFWWPKMTEDVATHVRACDPCNAARQHTRQADTGTTPLPQPSRPNERIHIDLFGPLRNEDDKQRFIMVITDAFTKIVRLQSIPNKEADTVAEAIMHSWVNIYGVPATVVSDQGREFCNKLLAGIWDLLKVEHKTTTPYHPKANAQAEVFNKTMAQYLTTMIASSDKTIKEWESMLGPLMLAHNTAVHRATRMTPFYTMFGYDPNLPIWPDMQVLDDSFHADPAKTTETQKIRAFHRRQTAARMLAGTNNKIERQRYAREPADTEPAFVKQQKVWIRATLAPGKNQKLRPRWEKAIITDETHPGSL